MVCDSRRDGTTHPASFRATGSNCSSKGNLRGDCKYCRICEVPLLRKEVFDQTQLVLGCKNAHDLSHKIEDNEFNLDMMRNRDRRLPNPIRTNLELRNFSIPSHTTGPRVCFSPDHNDFALIWCRCTALREEPPTPRYLKMCFEARRPTKESRKLPADIVVFIPQPSIVRKMKLTKGFEFGGEQFQLHAHGFGKEEIFHNGELVLSLTSMLGGCHRFKLGGKSYEIQVKMDASFQILVSGKVDGVWVAKPRKVFPSYLLGFGGFLIFLSIFHYLKQPDEPRILPIDRKSVV